MVSLQLIHCAPRHEKSHGCTNVDWKRLYVHGIKKLKLNTKSSTKAKFTTTDGDKALARSTECTHTNNNIYHDNKSTRLLSANGRLSSRKRTKHHIIFVTNKIQKGEANVAYCPTENMLADLFTKPLAGLAFWRNSNR